MSASLDTLTEKEKQTLRLLVTGYDAKSMARHLGLSVHTVNERLRDARRKLGTSSSREAARLLREAEQATPELLGDKALGDASAASTVGQPGASPKANAGPRRIAWLAGGLIMTFGMGLIALAALSGGGASATGEASPATVSAPAEQGAVLAAAQHWLALADAGDWAGSYAVMGAQFRAANTVARWTEVSERVHAELGAFQSRELLTVDYVPAPPNGFWTVKYRANYAKRTGVVETLSLGFEDGAWKVVGVMID